MNKKTKQKILINLIVLIIIFILIASSLSNLTLNTGMPLPELEHGKETTIVINQKIGSAVSVNDFLKIVFLIILAIGIIVFSFQIVKFIKLKNLGITALYVFLSILGVTGILLLIIYVFPHSKSFKNPELNLIQQLNPLTSPLGKVPVILLWFLIIIIFILFVLLIFKILTSKNKIIDAFNHIELEAQKARNALLDGQDLKDVIISCYKQMCLALEQENEIQREESMTVEEFECKLEEIGAPKNSIRELTQLFEIVRYGKWKPQSGDKIKAIKCFDSIIMHFKEEKLRRSNEKIK